MLFYRHLYIFLLFTSVWGYSQNLLSNSSFEDKTDAKFTYAGAHKTLDDWKVLRSHSVYLGHPSDALYVDTTLFDKFSQEGFPIIGLARETVLKPLDGTCYIRSNGFYRTLFYQELTEPLCAGEAYIVLLNYQAKSFSNEYDKFSTAHFGVSFSTKSIEEAYFRKKLFEKEVSVNFDPLFWIEKHIPNSEKEWTLVSVSFYAEKPYQYLYLGNHTDFETSVVPIKTREGVDNQRSVYLSSFLWFADDIKLLKLSDFLNLDFEKLKYLVFEIPILDEVDYQNDVHLKKLIKVLNRNKQNYKSVSFSISTKSKKDKSNIASFLKSKGMLQENKDTVQNTLSPYRQDYQTRIKFLIE